MKRNCLSVFVLLGCILPFFMPAASYGQAGVPEVQTNITMYYGIGKLESALPSRAFKSTWMTVYNASATTWETLWGPCGSNRCGKFIHRRSPRGTYHQVKLLKRQVILSSSVSYTNATRTRYYNRTDWYGEEKVPDTIVLTDENGVKTRYWVQGISLSIYDSAVSTARAPIMDSEPTATK